MAIEYKKFEIVGFDGVPIIEWGRSLPIGHLKNSDEYFNADETFHSNGLNFRVARYGQAEIEDYAQEGRLTMIQKPVSLFPHAVSIQAENNFLNRLNNCHTASKLEWQVLPEFSNRKISTPRGEIINPVVKVTFVDESISNRIMNEWAIELLKRSKEGYQNFYRNGREGILLEANADAVSARCGIHPDLRREAILLDALEKEEKRRLIYEVMYKPEFIGESWAVFSALLRGHETNLKP